MSAPFRVGLTGGIGSGKSTVCHLFSKLGVPIIDADIISHDLVKPGQPGLQKLIDCFGDTILNTDGTLNRSELRKKVFDDESMLHTLNSIMHPLVYDEINRKVKDINYYYCIISIPLLFESGGDKTVDRILLVDVPEELQIKRASERDSSSRVQIKKIIKSQMDRELRIKQSDDIISNDKDLEHLSFQVYKLHNQYIQLAKSR